MEEKITGKKMGVYVDGKLKLQTRNYEKAVAAARSFMNKKHEVWLTPIGSFVTA